MSAWCVSLILPIHVSQVQPEWYNSSDPDISFAFVRRHNICHTISIAWLTQGFISIVRLCGVRFQRADVWKLANYVTLETCPTYRRR